MSNWYEPTDDHRAAYALWASQRPERVRALAERFLPWTLYRLKTSGHRVTIRSFEEPADPKNPVTLKVNVTGEFNYVAFERTVFGIFPDDLEECELPAEGELLGNADMSLEDARAFIQAKKKEN